MPKPALMDEGLACDLDDAAHMLRDMGSVDDHTHARLLSRREREKIYGLSN